MNHREDSHDIPPTTPQFPPRPPRPNVPRPPESVSGHDPGSHPVGIVLPGRPARPDPVEYSQPAPDTAAPERHSSPETNNSGRHQRRRRRSHRPKIEDYDRKHERLPASTTGGLRVLGAAVLALLVAGLVAGAFYYGKQHSGSPFPRNPAVTEAPVSGTTNDARAIPPSIRPAMLPENVMQAVSEAFGLVREGELEKARDLFIKIQSENPAAHGMLHQIAKLELCLNRQLEAMQFIDRAIAAGDAVPQVLLLKGQILASQGAFPSAYVAYEEAAMADPCNTYIFFYWAETLRIEGRPRQAAEKLDQAHRRAIQQTDMFIIRTKWLLARIESDEGESLRSEIEAHLATPEPSGDWLLAAAALALQENRAEDAAPLLDRARAAMQPAFYNYCVTDKFFDIYRGNPAVGGRLNL